PERTVTPQFQGDPHHRPGVPARPRFRLTRRSRRRRSRRRFAGHTRTTLGLRRRGRGNGHHDDTEHDTQHAREPAGRARARSGFAGARPPSHDHETRSYDILSVPTTPVPHSPRPGSPTSEPLGSHDTATAAAAQLGTAGPAGAVTATSGTTTPAPSPTV